MEQFLKENEIIDIVRDYVEDKNTDYAIMIDGEWGSGKTYFVRKILEKKLKESWSKKKLEIKFIYVSAYGVKTTKELDDKIYEKIIVEFLPEKLKNKYKDIEKGLGSLYAILKELTKIPNIPQNSIRNLIEILQKRNSKNYVLIFDDLERCEMPITEVLGYINEFVEHKSMKTIIIANENEILKKKMHSNTELKYIVAENELLDIPKEEKSLIDIFGNKNEVNEKFNINEINHRVEEIFGEDALYNQIKEKLIGITIYYRPNLDNVIEGIIKEYVKNKNVRKYIKENKTKIITLMNNKNHINIRTLKIALKILDKVLIVVLKMDLSRYEERIIENVKKDLLIYTLTTCIEYKEGNLKKNNESEIFSISQENNFNENSNNGFKFVNDIVEKNYVDNDRIRKVIEDYMIIKSQDTRDYDDPINVLGYYWELDDEIIEANYKLLKEKLEKKQYKSFSYSKILYRMMKITNMGFPEEYLEEIKSIMLKNLRDSSDIQEYNVFDELDIAFDDELERKKYEEIVSPIKEFIENANNNSREVNINTIINGEKGWGQKFSNYCIKNKGNFQSKKEYFKLINVENLLECIKKSNTKEISDFRRCSATIYGFKNIKDFYQNDLFKLEKFLEGLESISEEELNRYDKSKKYNIDWLKTNIRETIEILNK